MRCKFCEKELKKDWSFCPYCGQELPKIIRFKFPSLDFGSDDFFKSFQMPFGGGNLQISIGTPRRQKAFKAPKQMNFQPGMHVPVQRAKKPVRLVKEVVEPAVQIKKYGAEIVIEAQMPGVSEENVEIKRVGESLEIRGYAKDRTYFKIIPVSGNLRLHAHELENSVLRLRLCR